MRLNHPELVHKHKHPVTEFDPSTQLHLVHSHDRTTHSSIPVHSNPHSVLRCPSALLVILVVSFTLYYEKCLCTRSEENPSVCKISSLVLLQLCTSSNLLEPHHHRDNKVCRVLSHEFGVVRPYRTLSNYRETRCAGCLCRTNRAIPPNKEKRSSTVPSFKVPL